MKLLIAFLLTILFACKKEEILTNEQEKLFEGLCISYENEGIPIKIESFINKKGVIFEKKGFSTSIFYITIDNLFYYSCKLPSEFKKANLNVIISCTSYSIPCKKQPCGSRDAYPTIISNIKPI